MAEHVEDGVGSKVAFRPNKKSAVGLGAFMLGVGIMSQAWPSILIVVVAVLLLTYGWSKRA